MCGIVGYIGYKNPYRFILEGLKKLEYRGYDSAGLSIKQNGKRLWFKSLGDVNQLRKEIPEFYLSDSEPKISMGIGHTRWATHGEPSVLNAHPHRSHKGRFDMVHNGIIENYDKLKDILIQNGYKFLSQTDSEVLVNWIDFTARKKQSMDLTDIISKALKNVLGAYALVIMDNDTDQIAVVKKSSPLVVGFPTDDNAVYIASDPLPLLPYTNDILFLKDNEIMIFDKEGGNKSLYEDELVRVDMDIETAEKGQYDTFMLKEIYEQPNSVRNTIRGRINQQLDKITLGGLHKVMSHLLRSRKITIVACGTSWHSALLGKYYIEKFARIPVEVDYASEYRYRDPIIEKYDIVIGISQSGETADTKAALEMAKKMGATTIGIVNVVGSSIARMVDAGLYTHSGVEIGVASTKAYTGQLTVLLILALRVGYDLFTVTSEELKEYVKHIDSLPDLIQQTLEMVDNDIQLICKKYVDKNDFLFMGRGMNFPTALEGALKLKEISYIHSEGYPAAEMKHGPIALIDDNCPSIFIATEGDHYDKVISNIEEVRARGGKVIAITSKGNKKLLDIVDEVVYIPKTIEILTPILSVIPLQLLSYHMAVLRGKNVDKPRNLAKSVTVE